MIAPDKPSGEAFNEALRKQGVETEVMYADIEPRVIGQDMNLDPKVEEDLARAIRQGWERGFKKMVIACNTLQLWINKARRLLDEQTHQKIRIITTFEAVRAQYGDQAAKPVWVGTSVLARLIPAEYFPTLLALHLDHLQEIAQEVIWRVKGVTGADVTTADPTIEDITSKDKLKDKTRQLVEGLKENGLTQVIMGCTELPIAFKAYSTAADKKGMELIAPADCVAEIVERI